MAKIKQSNIEYILNTIESDPEVIDIHQFANACLAEGVFTEFYIHYPLFKDLIISHNNKVFSGVDVEKVKEVLND